MLPDAELVRDFPFNPYLTSDSVVGAKVTHETNIDDGVSAKRKRQVAQSLSHSASFVSEPTQDGLLGKIEVEYIKTLNTTIVSHA